MHKIIIDLAFLKRVKLNINEYISLIQLENKGTLPFTIQKLDYLSLSQKGCITLNGTNVSITELGNQIITGNVDLRPYEEFVEELRAIYPSGRKDGKWPWRGFSKDIVTKLKKLDKSSGLDKYTNEQIVESVKNYVNQFSPKDMDKGMQLLQYFIEKNGNSTLLSWLEDEDSERQKVKASFSSNIRL